MDCRFYLVAYNGELLGPPPSKDAELLRLGEELDRRLEAWLPIHEKAKNKSEEWYQLAIDRGVAPNQDYDFTKEMYEEFMRLQKETGTEAVVEADHDALQAIDEVNKQIRRIAPTTIAGLAVWARATRFDRLHLQNYGRSADEIDEWDDECLVHFLDHIERLGGTA